MAIAGIAVSLALAAAAFAADSTIWPGAAPEEAGVDSTALIEMLDFIREHETVVHSVQLARKGRLVLDAYFYPYHDHMRHDVASVTKSISSTLVGLAIDKGHLRDVQQPILRFFAEHGAPGRDPRASQLTLEHLLTMQSGWDCGVELNNPRTNVDTRLDEMRRTSDWSRYAIDLPFVAEPGTRFRYCNANCHLLSALLTKQTGSNSLAFARRELFGPLGIADVAWPADPQGNNYGWGDLQLCPRDMVKIGQLFLQRGRWGERQIISENWIRNATRAHVSHTGGKDQYGYFWWVPGPEYPGVFEAIGRGGQRITVWPAKDLVLVYTGGGFNNNDLTKFILKAIQSNVSLPANPKANARLRKLVSAAQRPPAPQPIPTLPVLAARVSDRNYALTSNSLDLSALALRFAGDGATLRLTRLGKELHCPVGLDGVLRFSSETLVELPFACKGRWVGDKTFLLELDRVAGISCYRFKIAFAGEGDTCAIALTERTGLVEEVFQGRKETPP
jgi:CubicO group peptidase (beta-lactamase class C family)